ncbi:DUF1822 family protein [Trichormus variabilis]|uniref:DUF1822 domain-containing protein n=1 Tax=Trichormus variabilis SAG 1403-4b TaxID=447716 RepID=A0A433UFP1_ANAVA|nr:DUF1822 family protein [Trichormus variabilis]MBD2629288.1 DUF1822 family protein [Trichormus variabilis FACHB-164]RUS92651.1 hypothetical protein DSM107003_49230 [Trichormus variabilis SAG 1403-4b]
MSLFCVPPTQLWLEVSLEVKNQSWQQSQSFVSPLGRWNAFLNQVCLSTFLPWLQTEYAPEATVETLPDIWEVVSGTAINLDTKRLILIPDKNLETREFHVPQEWIDIPKLAGDYYLAVQVNPDGEWLRIWGYTTHEQLKNQGSYDPQERTYSLEANQMIEDLNVLWVVRQLYPEEQTQTAIAPLPVLSTTQAENLKQRLANPTITNPRLELPFEIWGALLEREDFFPQTQNSTIVNLRQWFENVVTNSWQTIESLFGAESNLAFSFRQTNDVVEESIRRVKVIDLPIQNGNQAVVLMLILTAETDGRVGIRAQLYPNNRNSYLPTNVRLALISTSGDVVQSVAARESDNSIQLKRFRCPVNTRFSIQVILDDFTFTEEFES